MADALKNGPLFEQSSQISPLEKVINVRKVLFTFVVHCQCIEAIVDSKFHFVIGEEYQKIMPGCYKTQAGKHANK
jgi:hypothetical protein